MIKSEIYLIILTYSKTKLTICDSLDERNEKQ